MAAHLCRSRALPFLGILAKVESNKTWLLRHNTLVKNGCVALWFTDRQPRRTFKVYSYKAQDAAADVAATELVEVPDKSSQYRERFVPITRRSMVRHLMQEKDFLTEEEFKKFEQFALALDSAIVNRYHGLLQELKSLFDPINPDKDTIETRKWNRRERLDSEFWLIQKLGQVMEKANFHELSKSTIEKALAEHSSQEGVLVSVNPDKYDILRFWALGKETPEHKPAWYRKVANSVLRRSATKPMEFYKRVVVAVRLKKDEKLVLKAFKEVPINALEQLLPDGKVRMSKFDRNLLTTSVAIASFGMVTKMVTYLAHVDVQWTLILTMVTGLIGVRAWTVFKNRHNNYVLQLSRMLYFKNIANNRGLLALLVDRAEDELFKEILLLYTFLLTSRPPSARLKASGEQLPDELGGMPATQVELLIEDWVKRKTQADIQFDAAEATNLLQEFGILREDDDRSLHVLPLNAAMRNLPQTLQSLTARVEEHDLVEGYERDPSEETDQEYKDNEKKRKRFGWF